MNNKGKSVVIGDGARLYQQQRSPFWWVAIRIEGVEKRWSTKVTVVSDPSGTADARDKARDLAAEFTFKLQHGIDVSGMPSFTAVAEQTIKRINALEPVKPVYEAYIRAFTLFLIPFFKKTPINKIDRHALFKFFAWREEQTGAQISLTQKRNTNKALDHLFSLACDSGYMQQWQVPDLPKVENRPVKARDFFDEDELRQVLDGFKAFMATSRNHKTQTIRQLLEYYVHFLVDTGARPGKEVLSLRFGDLSMTRKARKIIWVAKIAKGKMAKRKGSRMILLGKRAVSAIGFVIKQRGAYSAMKLHEMVNKHPKELIFKVDYRDGVPELGKPFEQYLAHLQLGDKDHTLYSLRHTYITQKLLAGDIPRRAIAKQCGTSEEMIEQYYDHVISLDYVDELTAGDTHRALNTYNLMDFME